MKKITLLFLLITGFVFAQTKKVVSSEIEWWGYKLAKTEASSHTGNINLKNGVVQLKQNKVVGGTFVLDMTTINSTDLTGEYQQKLNNHLKTGDFFEVNKFPTAVYKITSVKPSGKANFKYIVNGKLTVKGRTQNVSFPANITVNKGVVNLVSDKFTIDRQKFDIAYKSAAADVIVKDDIDLRVKVTAK